MKRDVPLVSVIVPTFNIERYIKKCLDSLLSQTLKEIEIPAGIKEIRYSAFANTGLEKVTLNEGLKVLDAYAFGFNDNLQELAIPKSVRKIVTHDILEEVKMITESGYRDKLYNVYKNSCAYMWARKNGLKIKLREEDKK